jgi:hypothetical protein
MADFNDILVENVRQKLAGQPITSAGLAEVMVEVRRIGPKTEDIKGWHADALGFLKSALRIAAWQVNSFAESGDMSNAVSATTLMKEISDLIKIMGEDHLTEEAAVDGLSTP